MLNENFLLVAALLLFVAVLAGKAAYRLGAPALLLFLGVGMLFGHYDWVSVQKARSGRQRKKHSLPSGGKARRGGIRPPYARELEKIRLSIYGQAYLHRSSSPEVPCLRKAPAPRPQDHVRSRGTVAFILRICYRRRMHTVRKMQSL